MKRIEQKEQLIFLVEKQVEKSIDKLFRKLHKKARTKSGDIEPMQILEMENISKQLVALAVEQVWQNME